MTNSEEKQLKLDKQRQILITTLDYLIENYTGYFVLDEYDGSKDFYRQEKGQTEKYYVERRLDRIKSRLARFTKDLEAKRDPGYKKYVEEKTGYSIDPYIDLRTSIHRVLKNKGIFNYEDFLDAEFMIRILGIDATESFNGDELKAMINEYRLSQPQTYPVPSRFPEDFVVTEVLERNGVTFTETRLNKKHYDGLKKAHRYIDHVISPNLKHWVALHSNGKDEYALTYLVIGIDGADGSFYSVRGENLPITAYWINDTTIIVETEKHYETRHRCEKVRTRNFVVEVKYVYK